MPRKPTHLHSVDADTPPTRPATPKTITDALDGSARDVLAAMRSALAKRLDRGEVSSNAIASAYKELRELDRLIRVEDDANAQGVDSGSSTGGRRSFNASAI